MASNRLRNLWYRIVYYLIFVFIYFVRNAGSNVLVHCRMGISRSASTVTWLLHCYPRIDTPTLTVTWLPLRSTFRGTSLVRWGNIREYLEASFETGLNGKITEINAFFVGLGYCVRYEGIWLVFGGYHETCQSSKKHCSTKSRILETAYNIW